MADAGTTFENRIASVGQLFQAEQQTFVYGAPPTVLLKPLDASLRRIDRDDQLEQLDAAIGAARAGQRRAPLVVLVEGVAEDELFSFVQRVGEHEFAEMMLPCDFLGVFEWPERSPQRLVTRLISAIVRGRQAATPVSSLTQAELVELIAGHDRSLAFAHQLDAAQCRRRPEMLAAWTALFGEACRNPAGGLLVCFLCVELCDPRSGDCNWLAAEVATLADAHGWCVLDTLRPVERRHVENWIKSYNSSPALGELDYIRPALAAAVFGAEQTLPYRRAFEELRAALVSELRPAQRFAA